MRKIALFIILLMSGVLVISKQVPDGGYKIVNKIHLEGNEKWDYLSSDDINCRLYISHGNMVQVIDETTGTLVGQITGLNGVHGIAIAPDLNKGFISCGKDSSVTIFGTHSLQFQAKIIVTGKGPNAIMFDPFSNRVFVFNGKLSVLENFPAQEGARTITVNKMTHHIYLPAARFRPVEAGKKPKVMPDTFVILDMVSQ